MERNKYKIRENIFKRTIIAFKKENRDNKRYALIRFRFANTVILLVLFTLFIVSNLYKDSYEIFQFAKTFSEAAMVGALADWFAVVALFRHPLNLPIPHTAIIPKNKDKLGESLKDFIRTEFLNKESLDKKFEATNPAKQISIWLSADKNRNLVTNVTKKILPEVFKILQSEDFTKFILLNFKEGLRGVNLSDILANVIEIMIGNNNHHKIIKSVVKEIKTAINKNREFIKDKVTAGTPWWTFGILDNKIYNKIISSVSDFLDEFESDPENEFRKEIDLKIKKLIEDLKKDENLIKKVEEYKINSIESEQISGTIASIINKLSAKLNSDINDDKSELIELIDNTLKNFSKNLESNFEIQEKINRFFRETVTKVITDNSESITGIISEKVRDWKEQEVTEKLEVLVGKDLQYIRVNGAIAGGIIGILIFVISKLISQ